MSYSADVSAGDTILAAHQNNLRKDLLDTSNGHTHNETDSRKLATLDVSSGHTHNETDSRKLATLDVSSGHTHNETDSRKLATLDTSSGHTHDGNNSRTLLVGGISYDWTPAAASGTSYIDTGSNLGTAAPSYKLFAAPSTGFAGSFSTSLTVAIIVTPYIIWHSTGSGSPPNVTWTIGLKIEWTGVDVGHPAYFSIGIACF